MDNQTQELSAVTMHEMRAEEEYITCVPHFLLKQAIKSRNLTCFTSDRDRRPFPPPTRHQT
eukprot:4722131-Pleurochrysis_carterae.AAC.1